MKTKNLLKKAFLLLALIGGASSAWGSTVSDLTSITSATTFTMDGLNETNALADKTLYAGGKLLCLGGCGYSDQKGSTTYDETSYKNVYQIKNSRQIALKIGFKASITIVGQSHSERTWRLGTASAGNELAESAVNTTTLTADVDGSATAQVVYINASGDLYLGAIIITEKTGPSISAKSTVSIKATESGTEVTEDFDVTGENLTGSTLTATLSPAVTGLSVTLGSNAITAGAISTTATLHYTQTVNASGSTTLTLSDGTTSKEVIVNYKSQVVATELAAVSSSEPTSLDLTKVESGLETIAVEDGYVVLTDAGSEVSFADNLAVAAIAGVGITWRGDAIQGPLFKFKTTVPGTVTVKFSDVGSSGTRSNRYANVNGTLTDVSSNSSSTKVTSSPIAVNAGDVIIKGQVDNGDETFTDNQIRVFTITFTPTVSETITPANNWSTYVTPYALDFSDVEGLKAYVATAAAAGKVTLEPVGAVPAGTPLMLVGTAGTEYTVPVAASASAPAKNMFDAGDGTTEFDGTTYDYILYTDGKFYQIGSGTVATNKAYLHCTSNPTTSLSRELSISFGGVTGVENVETAAKVKALPVKRIVNGKLVIENEGDIFNAFGQKVK